jgi:hypothetical protein
MRSPPEQVTRVSAIDSRFEALRAATTLLVGWDEEFDLLMRRWQQAKSSDGCIVGKPDIGKSQLARVDAFNSRRPLRLGERHVQCRMQCKEIASQQHHDALETSFQPFTSTTASSSENQRLIGSAE